MNRAIDLLLRDLATVLPAASLLHDEASRIAYSYDNSRRSVLPDAVALPESIEQIGAIYRVHRATVARWIADARELLLHQTRELLSRRVRVSNDELESILWLIDSQMDVSLHRCLDDAP